MFWQAKLRQSDIAVNQLQFINENNIGAPKVKNNF